MSRALAVFHGHFGRATVYQLNRPFNVHAHREGHLIFHVGGTPGCIEVLRGPGRSAKIPLSRSIPGSRTISCRTISQRGAVFFVLYVNAEWFARRPCEPALRLHPVQAHRHPGQEYPAGGRHGLRRSLAQWSRRRAAQPDRCLPRRELAPGRRLAGRPWRLRRHRLSRAQVASS